MENSTNNFLKNVFKGVFFSIISSLVFLIIFAIILTYTNVAEITIVPVIIVISGISILIGSILESRKLNKNGIWLGGAIGIIYMLIIYFISSLLNNDFSLNVQSFVMILVAIICGMIGGIIGVNRSRKWRICIEIYVVELRNI